jgi:hypothetical protein
MRLFKDLTGKGTYGSVANVDKRMRDICEKFGEDFRYVVIVTDEGRFAPVVIVTQKQQYLVGTLAYHGVCVTF